MNYKYSLHWVDPAIVFRNYSGMVGVDWTALGAGGVAGLSVDVALFPLDTLKTRLQSPNGFIGAGGFRGIYKG